MKCFWLIVALTCCSSSYAESKLPMALMADTIIIAGRTVQFDGGISDVIRALNNWRNLGPDVMIDWVVSEAPNARVIVLRSNGSEVRGIIDELVEAERVLRGWQGCAVAPTESGRWGSNMRQMNGIEAEKFYRTADSLSFEEVYSILSSLESNLGNFLVGEILFSDSGNHLHLGAESPVELVYQSLSARLNLVGFSGFAANSSRKRAVEWLKVSLLRAEGGLRCKLASDH